MLDYIQVFFGLFLKQNRINNNNNPDKENKQLLYLYIEVIPYLSINIPNIGGNDMYMVAERTAVTENIVFLRPLVEISLFAMSEIFINTQFFIEKINPTNSEVYIIEGVKVDK